MKHAISLCLLLALAAPPVLAELPNQESMRALEKAINDKVDSVYRRLGSGGQSPNANGSKCLDVAGDVKQNGNGVQLWGCNDAPNQRWKQENGRLVNMGGKCLDVAGSDINKDGGHVQVWDCNDAPNQQWRFEGGKLVNGGGKCLDVSGGDLGKDGGHVQIWGCNDAPNQKWAFE